MTQIIGIDQSKIVAASAVPEFRLGTIAGYDHPTSGYQQFVYGRAEGAVTGPGFVCVEASGYNFAMASVTTTAPGASGPGSRVAVAQAAMADNECGWFQVYGLGPVRTLASAAKGTRLNTTGTAGALDDDGAASAEQIMGITLLTATGGAAATNPDAMIVHPTVGITL